MTCDLGFGDLPVSFLEGSEEVTRILEMKGLLKWILEGFIEGFITGFLEGVLKEFVRETKHL